MLYTSSSLALSLLEVLAHLERDQIPHYQWVSAEIPEECIEEIDEVPEDTALYGSRWLQKDVGEGRVALAVPSVIVPESNFLLNPNHTDFSRITWSAPEDLDIDARLTGSRATPCR